jgi:hypothetical protein
VNGLETGIQFGYNSTTRTLYLTGAAIPPPPPTGLTAVPSNSLITLDWDDSGPEVASCNLYRSTISGIFIDSTNLTTSAYADHDVINGTRYYYVVTAVKTNGIESSQSSEVSAVPNNDIAPDAPTGLTAVAGDGKVTLDWNDNTETDFDTYSVYRSTTSSNYTDALAINVNSSSYTDNSAINSNTYYYVVTATDTNGHESVKSAEVSASPAGPPPATFPYDPIVFGSNNDGLGRFWTSTPAAGESWTLLGDSIQYRSENTGFVNASLLREIPLTSSDGSYYTVEGVMKLTEGYSGNNNRVGLYLFGDQSDLGVSPGEKEAGALCLLFNLDSGTLSWVEGIDKTLLASEDTGRGGDNSIFGNEISLQAEIVFYNAGGTNFVEVSGRMIDEDDVTTTMPTIALETSSYISGSTGWFGFVSRRRAESYPANPAAVTDYIRFSIVDPSLDDYESWASDNGIGSDAPGTNDFDGDGLANLYEYGIGGDPDNVSDTGTQPYLIKVGDTYYYVYPERSDTSILTYTVETTTNLLDSGSWTASGTTPAGSVSGDPLNTVSNTVDTVTDEKFIRLKIER